MASEENVGLYMSWHGSHTALHVLTSQGLVLSAAEGLAEIRGSVAWKVLGTVPGSQQE